ncbi:MAG: A24 family peptidase [Blastocatellia bacterium]
MTRELFFSAVSLLLPLTVVITYFDVKYRRIPNKIVLVALLCGAGINTFWLGWEGLWSCLAGCLSAFGLMLLLHLWGALGAGDVKLFAAIGGIIGVGLVIKTFCIVVFLGAFLAVISMFRTRTVRVTLQRVAMLLVGFLPGWEMPRYTATPDRHTIPYGVAITFGTLLSFVFYTAQ